jgi:hypothetical protein
MDEAPGWAAIHAALGRLYPGVAPKHWGTVMRHREGGRDPLDGISAYLNTAPPHWHFVTFGMSELGAKTSEDRSTSGWGFELTFRLRRDPAEAEPPPWALVLLQTMARYVYNTGNPFGHGHYIQYGGTLDQQPGSHLEAILFARDPVVPPLHGPNGKVTFLQAIGITSDEHALLDDANSTALIRVIAEDNPLLVTDNARASLLADPERAAHVLRQLGVVVGKPAAKAKRAKPKAKAKAKRVAKGRPAAKTRRAKGKPKRR